MNLYRFLPWSRSRQALAIALTLTLTAFTCVSEARAAGSSGSSGGVPINDLISPDLTRAARTGQATLPGPVDLEQADPAPLCEWLRAPSGEMVPVGPDCSPGFGSLLPTGGSEQDAGAGELGGCPYDYFPEEEWFATETRFAFPVADYLGRILPEPAVFHFDHDDDEGADKLDCEPFKDNYLCYDQHEGTDFMLNGSFLTMDYANIHAVAAARGVVMSVKDGHFDRCSVDLNPGSLQWLPNPNFKKVTCQGMKCSVDLNPGRYEWVPNPGFLDIVCNDPTGEAEPDRDHTNQVAICHPDGTISRYLHLMKDSILVEQGEEVACGEPLALLGSSGRSSAPHLHFEALVLDPDSGEHVFVDPYTPDPDDSMWLDQNGGLGGLPGAQCG